MNIFATDECPVQSALNLDDKRIGKMLLESAQMLSTAVRYHVEDKADCSCLYKAAYKKHPCTIWTRQSIGNFTWLVDHALALGVIFREIRGYDHKALRTVLLAQSYSRFIPDGPLQKFANCTEDKVSSLPIIIRYRQFMLTKWLERDVLPVTFTKRKNKLEEWKRGIS